MHRRRLAELDLIRGVAIVFVVLMHGYFDPPSWAPQDEAYVMRALYFLGHTVVPAFFLVSGYLYSRERAGEFRQTAKRKAASILVPTLVWSALAIAVRSASFGLTRGQAT